MKMENYLAQLASAQNTWSLEQQRVAELLHKYPGVTVEWFQGEMLISGPSEFVRALSAEIAAPIAHALPERVRVYPASATTISDGLTNVMQDGVVVQRVKP